MLLMFNLIKNGWCSQRALADPILSPFSAAWDGEKQKEEICVVTFMTTLVRWIPFCPSVPNSSAQNTPRARNYFKKKPQRSLGYPNTVDEHGKPESKQHNKRSEGTAAITNTTKHNTASEQFWTPRLSGSFCDVTSKCCKTWLPFFSPPCVFVSCTWPFGLLFVAATSLHNLCTREQCKVYLIMYDNNNSHNNKWLLLLLLLLLWL